jgi:ABC-type nitrate/sulfonate/bicarbonate transport system substrate-binding protein
VTSNIFACEEKEEGHLLIPVSKYVGNIAAGTLFATQQLTANNPDALRSFLAAWLEMIDLMRQNQSQAVLRRSEARRNAARHVEALHRGIPAEVRIAAFIAWRGGLARSPAA